MSMPEEIMLTLARFGNAPKKQPGNSDFESVVTSINSAEPRVIFPWFWQHNDVVCFQKKYINQLDQSSVTKIISDTFSILDFENSHWIERVNLFHLFGVSRLFPVIDDDLLELLEITIKQVHLGLIGVSATNASLLAKKADAKDANLVIQKISAENLIHLFASYQIYYYDGLDNLINDMANYIGTSKEVLIPATVNSIVNTFSLQRRHKELLYDKLVTKLPQKARNLI